MLDVSDVLLEELDELLLEVELVELLEELNELLLEGIRLFEPDPLEELDELLLLDDELLLDGLR